MGAVVDGDRYAQVVQLAERVRVLEKRIAVEHAVAQLLSDTPRLEDAAPRLLAHIAQLIGARLAELWTVAGHFVRAIAVWADDAERYGEFLRDSLSRRFLRGAGLPGHVWQKGEAVFIEDLKSAPHFQRHHSAASVGLKTGVALPIAAGGEFLGVMEFFADQQIAAGEEMRRTITSIGHDIAHAVRRERHVAELERANRVKDDFLATLSHELRTPMNAILGWLQMLSSGAVKPDEWPRAIATLERNARIQAQLIDDLLDISRVVSGRLVIDRAPVDFIATVQTVIESLRPVADAENITLTAETPPSAPPINGDARRLHQVALNLVNNAIKFTPSGGRVAISVTCVPGAVQMTVSDTGIGIDPAFLPHVFDRFRQEDTSSSREHGGLGLGLAIARHIVELHGGTITARSEGPGQGSVFTVRLPVG